MSTPKPPAVPKSFPFNASRTADQPNKSQLDVILLEDRLVPTGTATGTIFLDFNSNGVLDSAGTLANSGGSSAQGSTPTSADQGIQGVVVTAYDASNTAQGVATSAANGTYTLNMAGTGPYRLEFTNLPSGLFYGVQGGTGATGSGTHVQFVSNGATNNVNLSLSQPSATLGANNNPRILTNTYIEGENAGSTIVAFPYSAGTAATDPSTGNYSGANTTVATNAQVGATWGLAYNPTTGKAYAAAFTKRSTAFGPNGPGAIYTVDPSGATAPSLFTDLNSLTGNAAAGTNFRGALGTGYDYSTDTSSFTKVGMSGLGGLAVDDTGTYMYTIGLASRQLYRIRIPSNGTSPTAADVTAFNIPVPSTVTGVVGGAPLGDLRPFAVEFHNGVLYIGAVNSAMTTGLASDLKAYVFAFNPTANSGAGAFVDLTGAVTSNQAVFSMALNYPRGFVHPGDSNPPGPMSANWNPWTNTPTTLATLPERYAIYPQPELTGLAFDSSGNMTLGIRDRNGDQYGNFLTTDFPGTPTPGTKGISGGDTLRATINTANNFQSGWTGETITAAPPTDIVGPTVGGQFFWQQDLPPNSTPGYDDHQAVSDGGVLQLPGSTQVMVTTFDPLHISGQYDLGGVRWYDTTGGNAGGINKAYEAYGTSIGASFAKANGMGDLIAAPILGREIGNRVWQDTNGNGRQDAGESGIASVTVVLCEVDSLGATTALATATTDANGEYYFSSLSGTSSSSAQYGITQLGLNPPAGSSYEICIPVGQGALTGYQVTTAQATGTSTLNDSNAVKSGSNFVIQNVGTNQLGTADHSFDAGFILANAQLSGLVYEDVNDNGQYDAGTDSPIPNVTIVLTGVTAGGTTITPLTTTTDASGAYSFTGLVPGTYTVTETQPAGYNSRTNTPGTTTNGSNGTVVGDSIQTIVLNNLGDSPNNDFGEVRPAQLSGFVYNDVNTSDVRDVGDLPIPTVTLVLTGTTDLGAAVTLTTVTDNNGAYSFTNLQPGTYTVSETQPTGYTTRTNNPGTVTNGTPGTVSADTIQSIQLFSNANSPNNNFGEILSPNAQLSGVVYEDVNDNGVYNLGTDTPLQSVTVVLTGVTSNNTTITPLTTTTDATGAYSFTNLQPGTYTVTETQPAGYNNRSNTPGTTTNGTDGIVVGDSIQTIVLNNSGNSPGNNFGEVRPVQLSGFVYHDVNNDGVKDTGDLPIPTVTLVLTGTTDLGAAVTLTTVTDNNGAYSFTNLQPGTYTVSETQPANFTTRTNNPGTVTNGTPGTVNADTIQTIQLLSNADSPNNNFGEILTANAQLSGHVYEDVDNSTSFNGGDLPIAGVTVVLTGTLSTNQPATPLTTTTDANGFYQFSNLLPGTYSVTETQPANYFSRSEQAGTTGGTAPQNGVLINSIPLASLDNSQNNDFGEVKPATLAGNVYLDSNRNGVFDSGEIRIPNVTLTLTGTTELGAAVTVTQITATGAYSFTNLQPGTYTVSETQPAGFDSFVNTPGLTTNGTPGTVVGDTIQNVVLRSAGVSTPNNFGEVLRLQRPNTAKLSGYVYRDPNLNGVREPQNGNEAGIAGVTVTLYLETAPGVLSLVSQAQTDSKGFYSFSNLPAGTYRVIETQPLGFFPTLDAPGSTGGIAPGNNSITTIPLANGDNSVENDFGNAVRTNLYGYVWVDSNRNGIFDPGEAPIGGSTVTISGTAFSGSSIASPLTSALTGTSLTATTDSNGHYEFLNLPPGVYNLVQTNTPLGYTDFASQNASGAPVQSSTVTTFGGISAQNPAQGPLNFGKVISNNNPINDPSKLNFLGSSVLSSTSTANPLVGPATVTVNTTPPFGVSTGNPAVPTYVAVGAGAGFAPIVRVFNYATSVEVFRFNAFETSMTAGVRVTVADVNGDGTSDIICAAGPGVGPRVRVFDGKTGNSIMDFYAFPPSFRGGVYVAAADVNGDGKADLVCGAGEGGGPNIRVYDGATGNLISSFYAFASNQTGGVRLAVGDFNGSGTPQIAAANGPGNVSQVREFTATGTLITQFNPYASGYTGGVFLAAGDVNGDGTLDLVTGTDQGGGPNVRVFNAKTGALLSSFNAYESSFNGGVRVAVRDVTGDGKADIITGAGIGGASRIRIFSGATLLPVEEFYAFDSGVRTGVYVG